MTHPLVTREWVDHPTFCPGIDLCEYELESGIARERSGGVDLDAMCNAAPSQRTGSGSIPTSQNFTFA